ncbi:MAG: glycoside hydrolase family 43 protein [Lachnospiraceae bacterium]|nr:glycoside hydrolase family 43 protein [Lachnospiraceae bacterium]
MIYNNPVVSGFYPDPSVCAANGKFYMVCSSFQYFPGVPLFESDNLVNWKQIGHVLTRPSQVYLEKINSSGGVFAPTIRYNNGRFYMVTTNDTTHENFYVYTDDIYGEWSEPVRVDQGGIDPSLLFDGDKVYFLSNGTDDYGEGGVTQCELDIETGRKLTPSKCIWHGSGRRFLESPHMYHIGDYYYLMAAEGGTEYGHMITYARAKNPWGPFDNYPLNPVLTNKNKAPYIIQGIGHGDLIQDYNGNYHIACLGFRQIHLWKAYHNLGREVFLVPVSFSCDGWFRAGNDGTAEYSYEIEGDFEQIRPNNLTFANTDSSVEWAYLRHPHMENYELGSDAYILRGSNISLDEADSPTFIALRQRWFYMDLSVDVKIDEDTAGVTVYASESEHYDLYIQKAGDYYVAALKFSVGPAKHVQNIVVLNDCEATLKIKADNMDYHFSIVDGGEEKYIGSAPTKYVSTEVAEGFTGVMLGLYAEGAGEARFTNLSASYDYDKNNY